jgi:hypothetical protein
VADQFSPQDLHDAQTLLTELFTEVKAQEGTLAGGTKLGIGAKALQELRETRVKFGDPRNDLIQLTPLLFEDIGVKVTERMKKQMQTQFDFYYMTLTVSMHAEGDVQFKRMKCRLQFGPQGSDEPIIHAIFPTNKWRDILKGGVGISLALNGDLDWSAGVDLTALASSMNLPGNVKANIDNKNSLKAFITIPDYSFNLGQNEIIANGEGGPECFWEIEKPELQRTQQVKFGVVFKVSKDTTSVELMGLVVVEPSIRWLATKIRHAFEYLRGADQELIRRRDEERKGKERLPIGDHEQWALTLLR